MPYTSNDGVRIRYEVEGAGPPLVLHTGFMGRLEDWYRVGVVAGLQGEYRLILIDPRGHGASEKPREPAAYASEVLVADVVAVLDALGVERAHFWGYSRGGGVGFDLGVHAADRCRALIVGGAQPYGTSPGGAQRAVALRERSIEGFVADYERDRGPLPAVVRAQWLANDAEALASAIEASAAEPGLGADLAGIRLPTLVYCGDHDEPHDAARRAAEALPNATFLSLEGFDHAQAFRRGDIIVPRVRAFLGRVMAAAPSG